MLGEAGYEAIAPDWPGHGESGKPSASSFNYTQQAYLDGLEGFVQAAGIKTPFAVVLQVGQPGNRWDRLLQLQLALQTVGERPAIGCGGKFGCTHAVAAKPASSQAFV